MSQAIGLDIGHSAVKVAVNGAPFLFPTAALPAVELAVDTASESAKGDTVLVGSTSYFVGDTAVIHSGGRVLDGLSDNWVATDEHHALLIAGYQKALKQTGTDDVTVALGLPSRLHASQKERLRVEASSLLMLPKERIFVLPQPLAAFYAKTLDADGTPSAEADDESKWYVIDIGYYTTDFGCVDHTVWSAAGQESMAGTHVAAQHLKRLVAGRSDMDITIRDAERILRTKSMRDQGEVIDMSELVEQATSTVAKAIIDRAIQVFGGGAIRGADGILIAGGGSALMFGAIKEEWRHAVCATNPRFAVAEGLRRYGAASSLVSA